MNKDEVAQQFKYSLGCQSQLSAGVDSISFIPSLYDLRKKNCIAVDLKMMYS